MHITPVSLKKIHFTIFGTDQRILSGGNYLWGNFPGGMMRGQFSSRTTVLEPYKTTSFMWIKTVPLTFTLGSHLRVSQHLRRVPPWVPP